MRNLQTRLTEQQSCIRIVVPFQEEICSISYLHRKGVTEVQESINNWLGFFQKENVRVLLLMFVLGKSATELAFLAVWEPGSQTWNTLERGTDCSGLCNNFVPVTKFECSDVFWLYFP